MQLKIRISTANPGNQSEILQDQGINITVIKEINQRFRLIQFVFHDQRIDRNIDLDLMLVTITHGLLQLLGIKIAGIRPGAKARRSQINRVRTVVDRGEQRLHAAGWS